WPIRRNISPRRYVVLECNRLQFRRLQMEQKKVQTGLPQGSLFRDPPPRPQENEWSERETVHTPVLSAQDGAVGQNVRYVLGLAVVATVIAFFAVYLAYFA